MPDSLPQRVWPHQKSLAARPTPTHPFDGSIPISAGAATTMMLLRIAMAWILIMTIGAPAYSDQASAAYDRGFRAEAQPQYDAAYEAYSEAHRLRPKDPKYLVAYLRG